MVFPGYLRIILARSPAFSQEAKSSLSSTIFVWRYAKFMYDTWYKTTFRGSSSYVHNWPQCTYLQKKLLSKAIENPLKENVEAWIEDIIRRIEISSLFQVFKQTGSLNVIHYQIIFSNICVVLTHFKVLCLGNAFHVWIILNR